MTNPYFGKCNREALRKAVKEMATGESIERLNELYTCDDKIIVQKKP